jgi:hypothetical protein
MRPGAATPDRRLDPILRHAFAARTPEGPLFWQAAANPGGLPDGLLRMGSGRPESGRKRTVATSSAGE